MSDRYIIIVDRNGTLVPIVNDNDDDLYISPSREEAQKVAANTMLCRAYPYTIINFDGAEEW